jgi:GGDEF domain-containing protein
MRDHFAGDWERTTLTVAAPAGSCTGSGLPGDRPSPTAEVALGPGSGRSGAGGVLEWTAASGPVWHVRFTTVAKVGFAVRRTGVAAGEEEARAARFGLGCDDRGHEPERLLVFESPIGTAPARVQAAEERDWQAELRDVAACARDRDAERRDAQLEALGRDGLDGRRAACARALTGADRPAGRAGHADLAQRYWAEAAAARRDAAVARVRAARDRELAARDRAATLADCRRLAEAVQSGARDPLTGALTRGAGLAALELECVRASRNDTSVVVGYVDVVGLKAVNDSAGHAAGDALLRRLVQEIRSLLRPYDLVIRIGGDEFLCVMAAISLAVARDRFSGFNVEGSPNRARTGLAQWRPNESIAALIGRADAEMLAEAGRADRHDADGREAEPPGAAPDPGTVQ